MKYLCEWGLNWLCIFCCYSLLEFCFKPSQETNVNGLCTLYSTAWLCVTVTIKWSFLELYSLGELRIFCKLFPCFRTLHFEWLTFSTCKIPLMLPGLWLLFYCLNANWMFCVTLIKTFSAASKGRWAMCKMTALQGNEHWPVSLTQIDLAKRIHFPFHPSCLYLTEINYPWDLSGIFFIPLK